MMKKAIVFLSAFLVFVFAVAQPRQTENVIIVTMDGMRWQEVFGGVDSVLLRDPQFTRDSSEVKEKYGSGSPEQRRKKLFPFFWNTIATQGQLYGNRWAGSNVDVSNRYRFSYPGYNEIFTGYPDTAVNSNDKVWNKNENVLEYINRQPGYKGKVAAFATWDVFPYILNKQRSGLYVNAGFDSFGFAAPEAAWLNDLQTLSTRPIGVRPDVITYLAARAYLKTFKPKVLYIAFDETDDFAHGGLYDQYLMSAHAQDAMIADLWQTVQTLPQYRNKTTLLITADHGRGDSVKAQWRDHGEKILEASSIWIAAIGPDVKPVGEVKDAAQLYQRQLAPTIATLLGLAFKAVYPQTAPITSLFNKLN